jgi:DNA-binding NarL/FixJ family response regulator
MATIPLVKWKPDVRETVRVFIALGIRLYREGLADILGRIDGLQIVGMQSGASEVFAHIAGLGSGVVDVVLLDMATPQSYSIARTLYQNAPHISLVALGVGESEGEMLACAEAGITGYVTSDTSLDGLVAVVKSAARGEAICSAQEAGRLVRRLAWLAGDRGGVPPRVRLTSREREILALVDSELSNKEIAKRLGIEVATVKNHVHNLLEKLGVHRRSEAARLFHRYLYSVIAETETRHRSRGVFSLATR